MNMNKTVKKVFAFILTTAFAGSLATTVPVQAAEWQSNSAGWWWQENDGSYPVSEWKKIDGKWYHFNASGYMDTGWYKEGTKWYYLGGVNDGAMKTGWSKEGVNWYYLGTINDGAMKTGWQLINGSYYYMYSDGKMAADTWIGDYYVNANGAWIKDHSASNVDSVYLIDIGNGQTTTVTGHFDTNYANQVVELVNQYRAENGLAPLTVMTDLSDAAFLRSYETAYYFSHTRPNGDSCFSIIPFGTVYYGVGENIAAGQSTPAKVMQSWKNSPGHNANILGNYNCIGVGCFVTKGTDSYGQYQYYWVQIFGSK